MRQVGLDIHFWWCPKYVEQKSPGPMEQSLFLLVVLCVTQRIASKIQPSVLREMSVDKNTDEASPARFAFRINRVKRERES